MEKDQPKLLGIPRSVAGIGQSPGGSSLCNESLSQIFMLLLEEVREVERRAGI